MGEEISLIKEGLLKVKGFLAESVKRKNRKKFVAYAIISAMCFFYTINSQPKFFSQDIEIAKGFGHINMSEKISVKEYFYANKEMSFLENANEETDNDIEKIEARLYGIIGDHPIKEMVPEIAKYDSSIAGLIVGIAKKESNWGKRSPSKNGKDCYNYWGYKGAGSLGTSLGYGCFSTPEEGVRVIGARISKLASQNINTPQEMVVWKCGSSCKGHPPENVRKWVSDVSIYFDKINNKEALL